uniref:Putative LAGLIDADG homing endonuclease n=1 Tax=Closterium baillyanum TaxID=1416941 RepID=U5YDW2_9VIRI|nr:putative LAGLIDADG homing endonuclease [Closterium baillyanum]AGZ90274.1 putative LAGLIDADG homing endonuclease [Closterium baillyanum]
MLLTDDYIVQFWIGLMDGDGSIQVNHWCRSLLQYRIVLKLSNKVENVNMLQTLQKKIGGRVSFQKNKVIWVENYKKNVTTKLRLFQRFAPPLTTRLQCQIDFALLCLEKNDVNWYLENRHLKYSNCLVPTDPVSLERGTVRQTARSSNQRIDWPKGYAPWLSGFIGTQSTLAVRQNGNHSFSIRTTKRCLYLLESILFYLQGTFSLLKNDFYEIQISRKQTLHLLVSLLTQPKVRPLLGYKHVQFLRFLLHLKETPL